MRVRGNAPIAAFVVASLLVSTGFAAMEVLPAAAGPRTVVVLDPDDDDANVVWPAVGTVTELPLNFRLAEEVRDRLEVGCRADVVITRDDSHVAVPRAERKATAVAADPDLMVTLAFNGLVGIPWGVEADGGPRAFARPEDASFAQGFLNQIPAYTGRAATLGVGTDPHSPWYPEYGDLGFPWAHVEALFLDHNYDFPVIQSRFDLVADAVMAGILDQMAAQGSPCLAYPKRPSASELQRLRNLGYQNYQRYGADPVSMSTGNFVTSEQLFELPGVGEQSIDFTLNYNAQSGQDSQLGHGWSFEYGSYTQEFADGSVAVSMADGRTYLFQSDGGGGFTAPVDAFASLRVSGADLVWESAQGESARFTVNDDSGRGHLMAKVDRQGNAITLAYDGMGSLFPRLAMITDQVGQQVSVGTDGNGRVTSVTRPGGDAWTITYTGAGDLASVTTATGRVLSYGYDGDHLMVSQVGADGVVFLRNGFDDMARVVEQFNARGERRTMVFDDAAQTTTYTDTTGAVTLYHWDEVGRVTKVVDALSGETFTAYNGANQTSAETDAIGARTTTDYDGLGLVSEVVDPVGATKNSAYNVTGDLLETKDNMGPGDSQRHTAFEVNAQGRPVKTTNPDGTVTSNVYNSFGDLVSSTNELGEKTAIEYDGRGNTVKVTDPMGNATSHSYDLANRLVSTADPLGYVTSYVFDGEDNLLATTFPNGSTEVTAYDVNNQVSSVTDRVGAVTGYGYDAELNRTSMTLPNGGVVSYAFDTENRVTSITDAAGAVTSFTLDRLGRTTGVTDPLGHTATSELDAVGNVVSDTDAAGNTTGYVRDKRGQVVKETAADGGVIATSYDRAGRAVNVTDPLGAKTIYAYDWRGQVLAVTDPLGNVVKSIYDKAGRLIESIDAMGYSTKHELDGGGLIMSTTGPEGGVTGFGYDRAGNQTSITDANGNTSMTAYDAMGEVASITDALGNTARSEYDLAGQATKVIDALGNESVSVYDSMGQVVASTDPAGRTTSYGRDLLGNGTTVTAPDGTVTARTYDAKSNLTGVIDNATPGPVGVDENVRTHYDYDPRGLLTETTNAVGSVTAYEFDSMGRTTKEINPLGKVTAYTYDLAGNKATRLDANGVRTTYSYSLRGELSVQEYSTGKRETFEYDKNGNQTKARNLTADVITTFDGLGRVTAVSDGAGKKTLNAFDPVGNRTELTLPGGEQIIYGYDKANQNTTVDSSAGQVKVTFDHAGRPVQTARSNGVVTATTYTPANEIARLVTTKFTRLVSSFTYSYTDNGEVASKAHEMGRKSTNATYTYDRLGRLTSSTGSASPSTYHYDGAGNRVAWEFRRNGSKIRMRQDSTFNLAGQVTETTIGVDGLPTSSVPVTTVNTWDDNGNLTHGDTGGKTAFHTATQAFAYDEENRLTAAGPANADGVVCGMPGASTTGCARNLNAIVAPGNSGNTATKNTLSRSHDALGRVVTEIDGKTTTAWTSDGLDPVYSTHGTHKDTFVRDAYGDLLGQATRAGGIHWYVQDALSTIYAMTNVWGQLVDPDMTDYTDFGVAHEDTSFYFGYTGQRTDPSNNGLINFHARAYNPMTATWMQPDQYRGDIEIPDTLHRYLYVAASPTTLIDALGYNWFSDKASEAWNWVKKNPGKVVAGAVTVGAAVCIVATAGACTGLAVAASGVAWSAGSALDAWQQGGSSADVAKAGVSGMVTGILSVVPIGKGGTWLWSKFANTAAGKAVTAGISKVTNGIGQRAKAAYKFVKDKLENSFGPKGPRLAKPESIPVGALRLPGVPRGAVGTPVETGKGLEYAIAKGTAELDSRVVAIRIMDPVTAGKYQYPNGYAVYMNASGQTVNPLTGRTLASTDPLSHISLP